jgi:hypothetical protein
MFSMIVMGAAERPSHRTDSSSGKWTKIYGSKYLCSSYTAQCESTACIVEPFRMFGSHFKYVANYRNRLL